MQNVTVLRKVALHLFVKKKQKWDKNLVEYHVRGWWLRATNGGYVRGMVDACEGMAHKMEAGGMIQTLAQKVRARFCEQVHRTLP